jgi:hypothetical protein
MSALGLASGTVLQMAYTVPDIEAAVAEYVRGLGVGPWWVRGPLSGPHQLFRGQPTSVRLSIAVAFSGPAMLELIQQHGDEPSVYTESIRRGGYGFHHWGIVSEAFDRDVDRYRAEGYAPVYTTRTPAGSRVAYFDTTDRLPGMVELLELTPAQDARLAAMRDAAAGWDGSDPVRRP